VSVDPVTGQTGGQADSPWPWPTRRQQL